MRTAHDHLCAADDVLDTWICLSEAADVLPPGTEAWFWGKVVPELSSGGRRIFLRRERGEVVALLIAKRCAEECKICSLYVVPEARGRGIARGLMAEAMDWLGTPTPLMTIPAVLLDDCRGLIRQFGFRLEQMLPDYYRPGSVEAVFNGRLPERAPAAQEAFA